MLLLLEAGPDYPSPEDLPRELEDIELEDVELETVRPRHARTPRIFRRRTCVGSCVRGRPVN